MGTEYGMSAPAPSSPGVSERMSRQPSRNTTPEKALRSLLHARGLRYRLHTKVPGAPRRTIDIAFPRDKVAVFIDGCFWHSCPAHGTNPKSNSEWWKNKLARNVWRDYDTTMRLEEAGWLVLRYWEHENPLEVAEAVVFAKRVRESGTARTYPRTPNTPA
ncbi:very short patch repair endonuclease [Streptomyces sp. NPDC127584]|uniref:very short patch repair endonuclease n=1 Tax=Streptomyces sp. NPDC127584 TaxID=3345403 RepID=UPI00362F2DCA